MNNDEILQVKDYGYFMNSSQLELDAQIVVPFSSILGEQYLINSNYRKLFFKLAQCFTPQQHVTTCGVASSVIILNTIYKQICIKRPIDKASIFSDITTNTHLANFSWTEQNFFESAQLILNQNEIMGKCRNENNQYNLGISLGLLSNALNIILDNINMNATPHHVDRVTEDQLNEFRCLIKDVMNSSNQYIIANYNLNIQCLELDCGHFAPIAAYDQVSDRVLLLDPWASFSPWVWVKFINFYASMNTLDGNNYRGYITIKGI